MDDNTKNKRLMELTVEFLGKMSEEVIRIDKEVQIHNKEIKRHSKEIKALKENDKVLDSRIKRLERCKFIDLRI